MNNEQFTAGECAREINACQAKLFSLYEQNGFSDQTAKVKESLAHIAPEQYIRVVFIGQYSSGKSTIISALTGNQNIRIDSDIATDIATDYNWSNGILLTDTPGLYTDRTEHSERALKAIRESDLLIYCITSDLFNQYTQADFIQWAFEKGYKNKMFLVINKMSKEAEDYNTLVQNYTTTLNRSLAPHSLDELPHAFVDAQDYRTGVSENDPELIEISHFPDFIRQLNRFILQKGQLGKLDAPIQILKSSIDEVSAFRADSEKDKAFLALLSRLEKKVDWYRNQVSLDIHRDIHRGLRPIVDKGYELSNSVGVEDISFNESDLDALIENVCESLNAQITALVEQNMHMLEEDIAQVLDSDTADVFFKGVEGTISGKRHLFESKQTKFDRVQFETINEILKKITGQTVNWAQNGAGSAEFFLKASESSGSPIHKFVKGAGSALGYKFKPWQAANITKNIGNVAKVLGPLVSIAGVVMDVKGNIDEATESARIATQQMQFRQKFVSIADDLEQQYLQNLSTVFDFYKDAAEQITNKRNDCLKARQKSDALSKELLGLKTQLTEIQAKLF